MVLGLLGVLTFSVQSNAGDTFKMVRVGARITNGYFRMKELNTIADNWYAARQEISSDLQPEVTTKMPGINVSFGFQPYISFRPWRLLQIGSKVDFDRSPSLYNVQHKGELRINVYTATPGIFALFTAGAFEVGGSWVLGHTMIHWQDHFFGYDGVWRGRDAGWEIAMGFSVRTRQYLGFTFQILFRHLVFEKMEDDYGRVLTEANTGNSISLNQSGILLNLGMYFRTMETKGVFKK